MKKITKTLIIVFCFLIISSNVYLYIKLNSMQKSISNNDDYSNYILLGNKISELNIKHNKLNDDISSLVETQKTLIKKINNQTKLINSNTNDIIIINKWIDKLNTTFTSADTTMQLRLKYIRLEEYRKELKGE